MTSTYVWTAFGDISEINIGHNPVSTQVPSSTPIGDVQEGFANPDASRYTNNQTKMSMIPDKVVLETSAIKDTTPIFNMRVDTSGKYQFNAVVKNIINNKKLPHFASYYLTFSDPNQTTTKIFAYSSSGTVLPEKTAYEWNVKMQAVVDPSRSDFLLRATFHTKVPGDIKLFHGVDSPDLILRALPMSYAVLAKLD